MILLDVGGRHLPVGAYRGDDVDKWRRKKDMVEALGWRETLAVLRRERAFARLHPECLMSADELDAERQRREQEW